MDSMAERVSTLVKPRGVWWGPLGRDERLWLSLAVIWGLAMFAMFALVWPLIGREQNDIRSYRMEPAEFHRRAEAYIAARRVGEVDGVPIVAAQPGEDVYLESMAFQWRPVLQLKRGQTYRLLISSRDLQHGFSLSIVPHSINYQALPGFVSEISITPEVAGTYPIICNEYCGLGHHLMLGRIVVAE
jgi:cytochrome c oxidase subunit 2